jgi:hypothetical protein
MIGRLLKLIGFALTGKTPDPSAPGLPSPAPPTGPLAAITRKPPDPITSDGLRICIDFGTSSSAVTRAIDKGNHEFAILGYDNDENARLTIGSSVLWLDEQDVGNEKLVMGAENYEVLLARGTTGKPITRSLKRMLFDYEMVPKHAREKPRRRLRAMFRELLLLALAPRYSSTIAELKDTGQNARLEKWRKDGGLPWSDIEDPLSHGIEVCLCVPNSFGNQSISVTVEALNAALDDVRRCEGLDTMGAPTVTLVREAEAIAWAAINMVRRHERVLIIDIGAGTTDVAVVENRNDLPRLRVRAGIPFGGDDVDQALLVLASKLVHDENEAAKTTGAATTDLIELKDISDRKTRLDLLEEARREKEKWSSNPGHVTIPYLFRSEDPDQPAQRKGRDIGNPQDNEHYRDFLTYAITATCAPLLETLRDEQLPVDAVILSGSSSLLPQVVQHTQALLTSMRMTAAVVSISDVLQGVNAFLDISPVRRAKLACAWGAAEASLAWDRSIAIHSYVPETIRALHNARLEMIVEAGTLVAGGEYTRYLRLDPTSGHTFHFYRYFCPLSRYIEERHWDSSWVRRVISDFRIDSGYNGLGVRLALSRQAPLFEEKLIVWPETYAFRTRMVPYPLDPQYQPHGAKDPNPVTDLPMNWAWPS